MSTEIGEVKDILKPEQYSIEVATGTGGIRLFSTARKIWIDEEGAEELKFLLDIAIAHLNRHKGDK